MDEIDQQDVVADEVAEDAAEDVVEDDAPADSTTKPQQASKPTETLEQREARLLRQLEQTRKKLGKDVEKPTQQKQTDGLDENALDFLDLKGITENEDIQLIESIVRKTGQTVRQVLKDDYVVSKLESNKKAREVREATPSATKRSNANSADSVALAMAKFEQTGQLPDDFDLRSKVVDLIASRDSSKVPSWQRK